MKRHPALVPISREHHQMLMLAQLMKKDAPAYKGMPVTSKGKVEYAREAWFSLIKGHIEIEESVLFPFVLQKQASLSELINELRDQHHQIALGLEKIQPDPEEMDRIGRLLERHIRKEERVLFQQVQELLTEEEMDELKTILSTG